MSVEDAVTYEFTWHTVQDDRVCLQCGRLSDEVWMGQSLKGVLVHPDFGAVYDLDADISLTHPNCRCYLEVNPYVNLEETEVYKSLEPIFAEVKMELPSNIQEATAQVDKLRANFGQCRGELREVEYILYRTVSVINRLGLPPEVDQAIQKLERLIMIIRMLHTTFALLELTTPEGQVLAAISGVGLAVSALTLAQDMK